MRLIRRASRAFKGNDSAFDRRKVAGLFQLPRGAVKFEHTLRHGIDRRRFDEGKTFERRRINHEHRALVFAGTRNLSKRGPKPRSGEISIE